MSEVVPLAKAHDDVALRLEGGRARAGAARRPSGAARASRSSGAIVEAVAAGDGAGDRAGRRVGAAARRAARRALLGRRRGRRRGELRRPAPDAAQRPLGRDELTAALSEIWWSANSDSAITYRQRVGLFTRPSVGVVVQALLDPDVAGVMFTQNPITGADERVIEASWGLGEAVVAGLVIPDHFRLDRSGEVLERTPGLKKIAIRALPNGGTVEETGPHRARRAALPRRRASSRSSSRLADRCEEVYGPARDIEWAIAGGTLYLLQCRAVTRAGMQVLTKRPRRARIGQQAPRSKPCSACRSSPT